MNYQTYEKSVKAKFIWGVALMLVLVLGSAGMVPARSLDSREEAALFSLGDLGPVDFSSLWFRELKLTGSAMYAHGICQGQTVRTYDKAVELLARGDYPCRGLVSHLFPLADYRQAFQTAFDKRRHQSLKVALDLRN